MQKPNSKATKKDLTDYIEALEVQIQADEEKVEDLKTANEKLRKAKVLAGADGTIESDLSISGLMGSLATKLGEVEENVSTAKEKYTELLEAVGLKEAELKNLFKIETSAYTLSALLVGQEKAREDFIAEKEEILAKHKEELEGVKAAIVEMQVVEKKRRDEYVKETLKSRERSEEEYNYEFERTKTKKLNDLSDELSAKRTKFEKEVAEQKEEIEKLTEDVENRVDAIESKEKEFNEYKTAFEEMPNVIEEKVATAIEETKEKVAKEYTMKNVFAERHLKKDIEHKSEQIEDLKETIEQLKADKVKLENQVTAAYNRVQEVAIASVDGKQYKSAVDNLATSINKQG